MQVILPLRQQRNGVQDSPRKNPRHKQLASGWERAAKRVFFFGVRLVKSVAGKWSSVKWRMRGAIESVWKCSVKQSKAISDRFAGASVVRKSGSGAGEKWQEKATSRQMDSNYWHTHTHTQNHTFVDACSGCEKTSNWFNFRFCANKYIKNRCTADS